MRKDKYMYQIGDVLYEPSKMYKRVIEWAIIDIFVEEYVGGYKTLFRVESEVFGRATKFLTDIIHWYDTYDEAVKELGGIAAC